MEGDNDLEQLIEDDTDHYSSDSEDDDDDDSDDEPPVNLADEMDVDADAVLAAGNLNKIIPDRKSSLIAPQSISSSEHVIVNFDQSLPATHSYLGSDLEDVRGRTIFEDSSVITLPLLFLPSVVLVPGQVIPLQLYTQRLVAMVRRVADKDKTFGIVNISKHHEGGIQQHVSSIGCTAEIFSMKDEMDEPSGISTVRVKARGRQRFRVVEVKSEITGDHTGKVKILPEISLSHVLEGARLPSHRRLMIPPSDDSEDMVKTAVDRHGCVLTSVDLRSKNHITKLYSAKYTWWPPFVYKVYDIDWLMDQIKLELHSWCPTPLPADPVDLSFWVAHNLPVNDETRLNLLAIDSVVQRLRYALSIIRKSGVFLCCDSCQAEIASKKHVFSMCQEGPLGSFVNPGGYVHEMFTVLAVSSLDNMGRASTEHSWFPGYAWTIVQCKSCHSHMGWMFTATKRHLLPKKFWGLCRSAIQTSFGKIEADTDEESQGFVM